MSPLRALRSAVLCVAFAGAASPSSSPRARLLEVRAGGDPSSAVVELTGDRPLSFTTLRLAAPPRVVVDIADADVEPQEIAVDDGTIRRIGAAPAGARTARVVIELAGDSEFDIRAHGERVEVRLPRLAPVVVAGAAGPAAAGVDAETRAALPTVALVGPGEAEAAPPAPVAGTAPARTGDGTAPARTGDPRKPPPARKVAARAPPRAITSIGFRPTDGGAVIVRSDRPLEVGVTGEERVVLLHLPAAGIPLPNNRRPLDTRFFGGPVERVVPVAVKGGTQVRIELREKTDYQLEQRGALLVVSFAPARR